MESKDIRAIVPPLLKAEAMRLPNNVAVEACIVCDHVGGHYQIVYVGWEGDRRIYAVLVHLRVIAGKIHIERDGTANGFAQMLLDAGIPREAIVLAFHPPYKQALTAFGVA